jgi:hypothetical protein
MNNRLQNRWANWMPKPSPEPSKEVPKKAPESSTEIRREPSQEVETVEAHLGPSTDTLSRTSAELFHAGVRFVEIDGAMYVGIWSWMDGVGLRAALRDIGSELVPIVYLDGPNNSISEGFREYRGDPELDREPPPLAVVEAMYHNPETPWKVRSRMFKEIGWRPGTSENEWRRISAARIFAHQATVENAASIEEREKQKQEERRAWLEEQRKIQHAWTTWIRWRLGKPADAEEYRRQHENEPDWLRELAARRTPVGGGVAESNSELVGTPLSPAGPESHRARSMTPNRVRKIDPATGIWEISEWGGSCGRGFVSDSRFGPNQPVIKRTNRATSRRWRKLIQAERPRGDVPNTEKTG